MKLNFLCKIKSPKNISSNQLFSNLHLVNPLLSRYFCQKYVRENPRNFHTVMYYNNTIWARGWHQKYHPAALGLRDGIFDATQGPIWYCYYLILTQISPSGMHQKLASIFSLGQKLMPKINATRSATIFHQIHEKNSSIYNNNVIFCKIVVVSRKKPSFP